MLWQTVQLAVGLHIPVPWESQQISQRKWCSNWDPKEKWELAKQLHIKNTVSSKAQGKWCIQGNREIQHVRRAELERKVIKDGAKSWRAFKNTKAFGICPHSTTYKGRQQITPELNKILSKMKIAGIGERRSIFSYQYRVLIPGVLAVIWIILNWYFVKYLWGRRSRTFTVWNLLYL